MSFIGYINFLFLSSSPLKVFTCLWRRENNLRCSVLFGSHHSARQYQSSSMDEGEVKGKLIDECDDGVKGALPDKDEGPLESEANLKEIVLDELLPNDIGKPFSENADKQVTLVDSKYKLDVRVPQILMSYFRKKGQPQLKKIATETSSTLTFPSKEKPSIVISGSDEKNVLEAKRRLYSLLRVAKTRVPITHFISIPLTDDVYKQSFIKFKEDVLKDCGEDLSKQLFQNVNKLHLTIGVMALCDEVDESLAKTTLQECKDKIVKPLLGTTSPTLRLAGLDYFGSDPTKARVLYAKVISPGNENLIDDLCNQIHSHFADEGVARKEREKVTVHATLMNFVFPRRKKKFDASKILEKFSNFDFGEAQMHRVDLSKLSGVSDTGYYEQTATIEIP